MNELNKKLNEALMLIESGQYGEALKMLEVLCFIAPKNSRVLLYLTEVLRLMGRNEAALMQANKLVQLSPNAEHLNARGLVSLGAGDAASAETDFASAYAKNASYCPAATNLVSSQNVLGKHQLAISTAAQAIARGMVSADLLNNYGSALFALANFEHALAQFTSAVRMNPKLGAAKQNIVKSLFCLNRNEEALEQAKVIDWVQPIDLSLLLLIIKTSFRSHHEDLFSQCVYIVLSRFDDQTLLANLSGSQQVTWCFAAADHYKVIGALDKAEAIYKRLLQLSPDNTAVINNYGSLLFSCNHYEQARQQFQRVTELDPTVFMAYRNLGAVYTVMGNRLLALEMYQKSYSLNPHDQPSLVHLLDSQLHLGIWDGFYEKCAELETIMQDAHDDMVGSLQLLPLTESAAVQRSYLQKTSEQMFKGLPRIDLGQKSARTDNKIRVGYLSFDFRNHPVSYLTAELYGLHDRTRFEVYVYSYGPDDNVGGYRERIKVGCDKFIDMEKQSIPEMAKAIYQDNIDILIDLTGNTQHTRSALMAYRVAPVQAHWLGFMATMGTKHYDYIFSDPITSPVGFDDYFVEKLVRLPFTLQINDRERPSSKRIFTRSELNLPEGAFVFCNFTQIFKIQPKIFSVWMRILQRVPGGVMWLAVDAPEIQKNLRQHAAKEGIDPARLIFAERITFSDHLARYRLANLVLDTFPIGSGTSASDCLWMGCPMLVYAGELMYSRMAGGILHAAELDNLITYSLDDYEDVAVDMATRTEKLARLREHLLAKRDLLPLFDTQKFVSYFEQALLKMHGLAQLQAQPEALSISL